ncbi:hypothetical protein CLOSTMETH_03848 [[Clostridium] methylpentosum DSM 5476]|uniref:Uncharacterized protein n=1 Tax=[Clostridium] methylpentosum DSM 5476 TaxID=537013 RepID=C0EJ02_9FIRM|nr:hypothetical protein CLOSTMETH_03848 [[Clostridium] methylpentosum DSM 5476]
MYWQYYLAWQSIIWSGKGAVQAVLRNPPALRTRAKQAARDTVLTAPAVPQTPVRTEGMEFREGKTSAVHK